VPAIPVSVHCDAGENFDVWGNISGSEFRTSVGGWGTRVRGISSISQCGPLISSNVTIFTNVSKLSLGSVLVNFKLVNSGDTLQALDLAVDANVAFGETAAAAFGGGFVVYSSDRAMSAVVRNGPLVDDVTTFWFGGPDQLDANRYAQVSNASFYSSELAFAFSWQDVTVAAGATTSRSAVVRLSAPDSNELTLVAVARLPPAMLPGDSQTVELIIGSRIDTTCSLLLVIDGDTGVVYNVASAVPVNAPSVYRFGPAAVGVVSGRHRFALYAVDEGGILSNAQEFQTDVLGPTATVTPGETAEPLPEVGKAAMAIGTIVGIAVAVVVVVVAVVVVVIVTCRKQWPSDDAAMLNRIPYDSSLDARVVNESLLGVLS
jgi:hypothetical protein